jgi:lysophospholipase L1-like esterase
MKSNAMRDLHRLALLAGLGPLLWLQGRYVRRATPRLPEPAGARQGTCGQGPVLRLLIAGDSAAAGVGASTQTEALSGQLVARLAHHHTVQWQLSALTGHDSPALASMLADMPAQLWDVVVLSIGVNDVTALRSPAEFVRWQGRIAQLIQQRFQPTLIIHSALPPMHAFTALPQPLRWYFGQWAREMNRQLGVALQNDRLRLLHSATMDRPEQGLAADGFHPGPRGYAVWAESLSRRILTLSGQQ